MNAKEINPYAYVGQVTLTSKHLAYAKNKSGLSILDGTLSIIEPARRASLRQSKNRLPGTEHLYSEIEIVPASGLRFSVPLSKYQRTKAKVTSFVLSIEEWNKGLEEDAYVGVSEANTRKAKAKAKANPNKPTKIGFVDLKWLLDD